MTHQERQNIHCDGKAEAYSVSIDRLLDVKAGRMTLDDAIENLAERRRRAVPQ
jgi:hypothetical protein